MFKSSYTESDENRTIEERNADKIHFVLTEVCLSLHRI